MMKMKFDPQTPERLAFAVLEDGKSYELWKTPATKPGFHIFFLQHGVEITRKPVESELRGRIEFERKVEEAS